MPSALRSIPIIALLTCTAALAPADELRVWTSSTGGFKTEAQLVSFKEGQVELKKKDGKVVKLAIEKLSAADQKFVLELPATVAARKAAIQMLDAAAATIETIKDRESLIAAGPQMVAVEKRLTSYSGVLTTAMYLSKEAADRPRNVAENIAKQAETAAEYDPYRAEAKAILSDPDFLPAFRRYKGAIVGAIGVPDAKEAILAHLRVGW